MDDEKLLALFRVEHFDPIFEQRIAGLRAVAAAAWDEGFTQGDLGGYFGESAKYNVNPYRPAVLVPAQEDE